MTRLSCIVDVPPPFLAGARYALRMLLFPLGLEPVWANGSASGTRALYYGARPDALPPDVLRLQAAPEAWSFFERRKRYSPERTVFVDWRGERWPVLFGAEGSGGDLVASTFFWLSGWQEEVDPVRDELGRFPYGRSLQQDLGLAARPPVDAYREMLAERLAGAGVPAARRTWGGAAWACCPTHDIDSLRKWRPGTVYREIVTHFLRNARGIGWPGRWSRLKAFARDWLQPGKDGDRAALERLIAEERARGIRATYFLKTNAHAPHDVYYDPRSAFLRRTVRRLEDEAFEVGLHPSFHAHNHPGYLADEQTRLSALTRRPPRAVRQHYLRYEHPVTPRLQAACGFRLDSTLGFSEHEGFRNGTCLPFQLFDRRADAPLDLWEMPLAAMDATLFGYRKLDPDEALARTLPLLDACRRFGGVFVGLWHNTVYDALDHPGQDDHFHETLDRALAAGAFVGTLSEAFEGWRGAGEGPGDGG